MITNRQLITPLVLIMAICGSALVSDAGRRPSPQTGYTAWRALTPQVKRLVIAEAINSFETGWYSGQQAGLTEAEKLMLKTNTTDSIAVLQNIAHLPVIHPPLFSHRIDYYRGAIDRMYAVSRPNRDKSVGSLLLCLSDVPVHPC